ncbi:hypothetical protein [Acerihabitans arboris]|uniref:Uncharacterized protein n=1 Tax=Acerihabitans arboris TaxID=2691583 RepID=A0A845SK47_9GAMM|nr:hypothetical protein [Acerihabitans arboris]NDL61705.1 hypothetical protein [Acerihabitans arboris]
MMNEINNSAISNDSNRVSTIPAQRLNNDLSNRIIATNNYIGHLSLYYPCTMGQIFSHLKPNDYSACHQALTEMNAKPPVPSIEYFTRKLKRVIWDEKSIPNLYKKVCSAILVDPSETTSSYIKQISNTVIVGNKNNLENNNDRENHITISMPAAYNQEYSRFLLALTLSTNESLGSFHNDGESELCVKFTSGPSQANPKNTIIKFTTFENMFDTNECAATYLKCIMDAADRLIKKQQGEEKLLCALTIKRVIDYLKLKNHPNLDNKEIENITKGYPYLLNLAKALRNLYPELDTNQS